MSNYRRKGPTQKATYSFLSAAPDFKILAFEGTLGIFFSRILVSQMRKLKHRKQELPCGYVPDSPLSLLTQPLTFPPCSQVSWPHHLIHSIPGCHPGLAQFQESVCLYGNSRPHWPVCGPVFSPLCSYTSLLPPLPAMALQ